MADYSPSKNDLNDAFKRLRAIHSNKVCFDCKAKNPSWATVTYGAFICLDCSAVHRSLGVHISFVKSSQLDSNWTIEQLRNMQLGGNANAETFFRQHNCNTTDAQQKYNSRAAQLYRENLIRISKNNIKLHGTSMLLETHTNESQNEEKKDVDFFESQPAVISQSPPRLSDITMIKNGALDSDMGPNVDAAVLSSHSVGPPRKSTIGQRKPASKLGAKKLGGLGAQRVKKDFATIEKEAARCDEMRKEAKVVKPTKEQSEKSLVSLQKAYENMGLETKKEEEKMRKADPKKAAQAERLGMGLGMRSGVSHSLFEDVKTIQQETPAKKNGKKSSNFYSMRDSDAEDEFFSDEETSVDNVIRFNSGPPKYKDSPFEDKDYSKPRGIDDLLRGSKSSNWDDEFEKIEKPSPSFLREKKTESTSANYKFTPVDDGNARAKFGNAKAISSDMMFGNNDPTSEMRLKLSQFETSGSISSADLFGESQKKPPSMQTPDLDDVRESVRQGVTKVAGRLSNMATNVMSSLQDRYA